MKPKFYMGLQEMFKIEKIISIKFILFLQIGKDRHYSISVAEHLGSAHGTQVFRRRIVQEELCLSLLCVRECWQHPANLPMAVAKRYKIRICAQS